MLHDNVEFHNVAELQKHEHIPGLLIQRFPQELRETLGCGSYYKGWKFAQEPSGSELRFVSQALPTVVRLMAIDGDHEVLMYRGGFFHSRHHLKQGAIHAITLEDPPRFSEVETSYLEGRHFSPLMWRCILGRGSRVAYLGVDTLNVPRRPPTAIEKPQKTIMFYGSSITHGSASTLHHNCYAQLSARLLGMDALNLGISGSCFMEPQMVDYLCQRADWQVAFFEIGVNLRTQISPEEFKLRLDYLLQSLARLHPEKPVFFTTVFPNYQTRHKDETISKTNEAAFNAILASTISAQSYPGVHLLSGKDILTDDEGLSTDLLHPADYGHIIMGQNLAKLIREYL